MSSKPVVGEALWGDDPQRFKEHIARIESDEMRTIALDFYSEGFYQLTGVLHPDMCDRARTAIEDWLAPRREQAQTIRPADADFDSEEDGLTNWEEFEQDETPFSTRARKAALICSPKPCSRFEIQDT